jgi:hypothetical protein
MVAGGHSATLVVRFEAIESELSAPKKKNRNQVNYFGYLADWNPMVKCFSSIHYPFLVVCWWLLVQLGLVHSGPLHKEDSGHSIFFDYQTGMERQHRAKMPYLHLHACSLFMSYIAHESLCGGLRVFVPNPNLIVM